MPKMILRSRPHALRRAALALCAAVVPALSSAADAASYRLERTVAIPSGDTGWDYNSLDAARGHMFIAHRKAGLHVYDTRSAKVIKTLEDSAGTNTSALALEFDLGIAGTTDGHVLLFRPSTLKTLSRSKSSTDGFDGATFDPVSQRFAMVGEADPASKTTPVLFFDARTGQAVGSVELASVKVDAPRPDERGNILLPLRDKGTVARIDMKAMKVAADHPLTDCLLPAALEVDTAHQRVFVGCRGKGSVTPALAVLDAATGRQIARLAIGRGVDEVMFDRKAGTIVTANGEDGSMTLIRQRSADDYSVEETIGTVPMARTGVLDERDGKIYLVAARYTTRHESGKPALTSFVPNSFSVLTYSK